MKPLLRKCRFFYRALWFLPNGPQSTPSTGIPTEKMGKYLILGQLNVVPPPSTNPTHVPKRVCANGQVSDTWPTERCPPHPPPTPPTYPREYVPVDQASPTLGGIGRRSAKLVKSSMIPRNPSGANIRQK